MDEQTDGQKEIARLIRLVILIIYCIRGRKGTWSSKIIIVPILKFGLLTYKFICICFQFLLVGLLYIHGKCICGMFSSSTFRQHFPTFVWLLVLKYHGWLPEKEKFTRGQEHYVGWGWGGNWVLIPRNFH